jgi:hypothetical protein
VVNTIHVRAFVGIIVYIIYLTTSSLTYLFIHLTTYFLLICLFICLLFIYLTIYFLFICLFLYLLLFLTICLFIYYKYSSLSFRHVSAKKLPE